MADVDATPAVSRRDRRRAETRSRLFDAARELFAEQGVEATRINQITERADVGFGSFYNHFDDKDAIVEAVVRENSDAYGATLDALREGIEDPAEVVAVAHRKLIDVATEDPTFAWLMVRLDISQRLLLDVFAARGLRDLNAGLEAGRFSVSDPVVALYGTGGALVAVMRAVLQGEAGPDAAVHHAENVLRIFGLAPADAAEVARRPMPVAR